VIVADASVLTDALAFSDQRGASARTALSRDSSWQAPEHWKAEVFSAVRGLAAGGHLSPDHAEWVVRQIPGLAIASISLDGLLGAMWHLRANFSGYDAAYVALARLHDLTLVTADGRLARAATEHCRVELVSPRG
jgi:predicted nucleic acid-binding protein